MSTEEFTYLFSPSQSLLEPNVITKVPDTEEGSYKDYIEYVTDTDSDVLSHSDMSWESMEDRYVPFEVLSDDSTDSMVSTASAGFTSSAELSLSLLNQVSIDEDSIKCVNESSWSKYALNFNLWDDKNAPVVKIRHHDDILLDDLELGT
nr:PREDICTED: uncharacterized protein LOC105663335 isoform X2 [Megachile rotundata]